MADYRTPSPADIAEPTYIDHTESDDAPDNKYDEETLRTHMHGLLSDAIQFVDGELSPVRALATDYYWGKPFGNEEEGRSTVVLTEVRDAVSGTIPGLVRAFFGPERVVEFKPTSPLDQAAAEQATDYVQDVFENDNDGFIQAVAVLKDGLVRKLGGFKWYWEYAPPRVQKLYNVSEDELAALESEEGVTITSTEESEYTDPQPAQPAPLGPDGQPQPQPAPHKYYDVELRREDKEGYPCIVAMPPEEILITRQARGPKGALLVGHRTEKTRSELIAMGVDEDILEEWGKRDIALEMNPEEVARREATGTGGFLLDPPAGEENDKILYIESYTPIDMDGDDKAELRLVKTIGPSHYPISWDPADEIRMSFFTPDPEPHTFIGGSMADRLMDMQKTKSSVFRAMLDSLSLHIYPRMGYVEGQVSVEDVLNTAIGAPIRQRAPGMVQPILVPYVGADGDPMLDRLDEVIERRTGRNKGALGLDADALQSTEKMAAKAAVTASQAQDEFVARVFAEMCLKPLFKGILHLLIEYQPRAKMKKLRGRWVEVDPRVWNADWGVHVNVALGTSSVEDKLAGLKEIYAEQKDVLVNYGPSNPLVTVAQLGNTLKRAIRLLGYADTSEFCNDVPANWQPPQQPQQPSPEMIQAQTQLQIEQMKTQREMQIKQAELALKKQQMQAEQQLKYKQMADDFVLRLYQIDAQNKTNFREQDLEADATRQTQWLEGQNAAHDRAMAQREQAHQEAVSAHQASLAEDQQAHDQEMAERQTAAQEQAAAQQGSDSGSAE